MGKHVFFVNGKKAVLDTDGDYRIYKAPRNPPNTGTDFTAGTDLFLHKCKDGRKVFYYYSWSMWQGHGSNIRLTTEEEAKKFFYSLLETCGWTKPDDSEVQQFNTIFGEDPFEE